MMRLAGSTPAVVLAVVFLPGAVAAGQASQTPAGLIVPASPFAHEAQVFGHGDPIGQNGGWFGNSVSLSGDTLVVGAFSEEAAGGSGGGAAYVFVRSGATWTRQQKLAAPDSGWGDGFGTSVSISGDTIVVGAPGADAPGAPDAGAAYVFLRSGVAWTLQQKIWAASAQPSDGFGASVSISGDTALVGAPTDDTAAGTDTGSASVFVRSGTVWSEQQAVLASDAAANDEFGASASLSGDTAVIGAPAEDNAGGAGAGSAYVFVRAGTAWTQQQKLMASDGAAIDGFGSSVAAHADTVVVGAPRADISGGTDGGAAYAFLRVGTAWTQQQKLLAPDGLQGDTFGTSVSVSGDSAVVGSPFDDTAGGFTAGSAYVFVRSGVVWTQQQQVLAIDGSSNDKLGYAVVISGDTLVAGAPYHASPAVSNAGCAYVFVRSGGVWSEQDRFFGSDLTYNDRFGHSVSLSGDTLVVGAFVDDTSGWFDTGSAYVFVRSGGTWAMQQKIVAADGYYDDWLGYSVAVSGDTVVLGVPSDDTTANNAGSAYVFFRSGSTWSYQQKLVGSGLLEGDGFGDSVAIDGDTIVVGATRADTPTVFNAGAAYVFVRSGTTWTEQKRLVAPDGEVLDRFGFSLSLSADTVVVGAYSHDLPAGSAAGTAYVFVRSGTTWTLQQQLTASDAAYAEQFGFSVSVSGDTAVVGANWGSTPAGDLAGSAYVFVRSGTSWSQQQKLIASDGVNWDMFGHAVSVSGDTAVVGYFHNFPDQVPGGAYVFVRSGTTWTQQSKLVAPDGADGDAFGSALSISGDTLAVGAFGDDTPDAMDGGSVHIFRKGPPAADLGVTKTDGQTAAVPGEPVIYVIGVSNAGPDAVAGATVTDVFPPALLGSTWTCSPSPGSSCTQSGNGNINDIVSLLVGGTATYTVTGTVDPAATGALSNTVTVMPPAGQSDPNPANNTATDVDILSPETDLAVAKADSADPVNPGDPLSYTLTFTNNGPSHATAVTVVDTLPAGVTFVSSVPGAPTCTLGGTTLTCSMGSLNAGSTGTVTINVTVDAGAGGMLVNTATVSGYETDPDTDNNTTSAATAIGRRDGELAHGTNEVYDLAALPGPLADEDVFRIHQMPLSSYEIVIDATSGDIGNGNGPLLERLAPDGTTVIQTSVPVGTGPSRSLRWANFTSLEVESETIRVRSAGCTTDCGPDDVYRIRAYETTYSVARFNNTGSQVTVLILQNPTTAIMGGAAYLRNLSGSVVCTAVFGVTAHHTVVIDTTTCPGANGIAGSITVSNINRYGEISGKAVSLEPSTGFSFDSPLVPRLR